MSIIDIEDCVSSCSDFKKTPHKSETFSKEQWEIILKELKDNHSSIRTVKDLNNFRLYIQTTHKLVLSNSNFILAYNKLGFDDPRLKYLLTKKKNKSNSGVIVVTVLTAAHPIYTDNDGIVKKTKFSCAWNCHYCPNEKASAENNWIDQPRSYLFQEPAVLRANENDFDAILQFNARITTLIDIGHSVDKIELIILGGTWCSYPENYQEKFITELYYAANTFYDIEKRPILSLEKEIEINENTRLHIIGLTLETRPDTITLEEIKKFRKYNATRIQLGVQHTDNKILKKINRGHTIESAYKAIRMLKENGYKVDIHLMPNLPGASYEADMSMLNQALYDDRLQVDQLKIYPCAVVPFTKIKEWYDEGSFVPYDDLVLFDLIKEFKKNVQTYKRLNRIIRDIPSTYITGGYDHKSVNMRQLFQNDMKKNGWKCRCIRCREIGGRIIDSKEIIEVVLKTVKYRGSEGDEYFISFETTSDYLIGFIRLRINTGDTTNTILPILKDSALIRELHVYSSLSCVGSSSTDSMQHKGYGKKLVEEAEKIAMRNGKFKMAIISGTGVRNYYRRLGYKLQETYMIKHLKKENKCIIQ
jgi:ELP3 family radical SAM enzyme/protein acetyltransferase